MTAPDIVDSVLCFICKGGCQLMSKSARVSVAESSEVSILFKEIEAVNIAAKNGPQGIKEYLQKYNEQNNIVGSTFFKPVEMSQEEEEEFKRATTDIDWDKENRSEDKAIKQAFLKAYQANGVGPGDDKLIDAVKKYRATKEKNQKREDDVLENIAEMLFSPTFQELLQHSTPQEIDQKVQSFLS